MDEADNRGLNDLPDQWWILAGLCGLPPFFYYWLLQGLQFKGCIMGGAITSVVLSAGFFLSYFRSIVFSTMVLALVGAQVTVVSFLNIPNIHGPSYWIFLPMILVDGGLCFFLMKLASRLLDR